MIIARENESIDSMLRRFKKEMIKSGKLIDYSKHQFYESKSIKEKKKHEAHIKRVNRELAKKNKYIKDVD